MSSSQCPQSLFGRADDLISQAVNLRAEAKELSDKAKELAEKANHATTRAGSLEDAAAALQRTATLDRQSLNVQLEDVLKRCRNTLDAFRNVPEKASQLQRIKLATKQGTASPSDILSLELELVALQEGGSKNRNDVRVYINGLHHSTRRADLFEFFSGYEVLRCYLAPSPRGRLRTRHGFVVLRDVSVAEHAVKTLTGRSISGNQVSVQLEKDWKDQLQQTQAGGKAHVLLSNKRHGSQLEDSVVTDVSDAKRSRLQNFPGSFHSGSHAVKGDTQYEADDIQEVFPRSAIKAPNKEITMTSASDCDTIVLDADNEDPGDPKSKETENQPYFKEEDGRSSATQPSNLARNLEEYTHQSSPIDALTAYQSELLGIAMAKAKCSADEARNYLVKQFPRSPNYLSEPREGQAKSGTEKLVELTEIHGPCCLVFRLAFSTPNTHILRPVLDNFGRIVMWKEGEFWQRSKYEATRFRLVLVRYSNEFSCNKAYEAGRESAILPGADLLIFKPIR